MSLREILVIGATGKTGPAVQGLPARDEPVRPTARVDARSVAPRLQTSAGTAASRIAD